MLAERTQRWLAAVTEGFRRTRPHTDDRQQGDTDTGRRTPATRLALASCLLLLGTTAAAETETNLVRNPGFEETAGPAPVSWPVPRLPGARFALDDQVAHAGTRSARVDGIDPDRQDQHVQAWRQDIGPLPDRALRVSAWVRTDRVAGGRLGVLHKAQDGTVLRNQVIGTFEGTADWRELAGTLERVPETVSLQVLVGLAKSGGTVWIDDVAVAPMGDPTAEFGTVTFAPTEPQEAGATAPVCVEVTLGRRGLATGGSLQLRWGHWRPAREFQLRQAAATCAVAPARLALSVPPRKTTWPPENQPVACVATLAEGGPLPPGTVVRLTGEMVFTKYDNVSPSLEVLVSAAPGSAAVPLVPAWVLKAHGGPAQALRCVAEARPLAGQPGRVTVAAVDAHGNPATGFRGTVHMECATAPGLPAQYVFTEADAGSHEFAAPFAAGVVSRLTVSSGTMAATSNPVLPRAPDEPGVFFGDIHSHSEISSDAVGDPDQAYDYARRFLGLDLAALTDHAPRGPRWERAAAVANRHLAPGRFVTFVALEAGDGPHGHRNLYYRDDTGPELPLLPDYNDAWWTWLGERRLRALTVPHHPNTDSGVKLASGRLVWGPTDWSKRNDTCQRLVEICQSRGAFEVPGGPLPELRVRAKDCGASVQTALASGQRLGFIGSTDSHSGRPGEPGGQARCAILGRDVSRPGLWDALYDRHCYATTGAHILVLFTLNGQPMGSELRLANAGTPRTIAWRVVGAGPLRRVDLLRNNETVQSWNGDGRNDLAAEHTRTAPLEQTEWWYLRVLQEDTAMAWSSPVWVDPPRP